MGEHSGGGVGGTRLSPSVGALVVCGSRTRDQTTMHHPDLERFEVVDRLADRLVIESKKDGPVEVTRIPALDRARHQADYSEPPAAEHAPPGGCRQPGAGAGDDPR